MEKIRIRIKNRWNYSFDTDNVEALIHSGRRCPSCEETWLDPVYCHIVDSLKEAGLLHEDFKEMCCCCLVLKHFGMMDLRKKLLNFHYVREDDYLLADFCSRTKSSDIKRLSYMFQIRIHDWSKIELF